MSYFTHDTYDPRRPTYGARATPSTHAYTANPPFADRPEIKDPVVTGPARIAVFLGVCAGTICSILALASPYIRSRVADDGYVNSIMLWKTNLPQVLLMIFFLALSIGCLVLLRAHRSRLPALAVGGMPLFSGVTFGVLAVKEKLDVDALNEALGYSSATIQLGPGFWWHALACACLIAAGVHASLFVMRAPRSGSGRSGHPDGTILGRGTLGFGVICLWIGLFSGLLACLIPLYTYPGGFPLFSRLSVGEIILLLVMLLLAVSSRWVIRLKNQNLRERMSIAVGGLPLLTGITVLQMWLTCILRAFAEAKAQVEPKAGFWFLFVCSFSLMAGGLVGTYAAFTLSAFPSPEKPTEKPSVRRPTPLVRNAGSPGTTGHARRKASPTTGYDPGDASRQARGSRTTTDSLSRFAPKPREDGSDARDSHP